MSHPQHPHCIHCGKALFKSPAAAKVKPADPYAFCRNAACVEYTFRSDLPADPKRPTTEQLAKALRISGKAENGLGKIVDGTLHVKVSKEQFAKVPKQAPKPGNPAPAPATQPAPVKPLPVSKRGVSRKAAPASEAPAKPQEAEPLAKARVRLREILAAVTEGQSKEGISLVLAILNQESGNQKAAEALITEFELDKKYGLLKFT